MLIRRFSPPGPRCVDIVPGNSYIRDQESGDKTILKDLLYLNGATEGPPALLFTTQESRLVALKHYQPFKYRGFSRERMCYIDPLTDIVFYNSRFLTCESLKATFNSLPKVARLAVEAYDLLEMDHKTTNLRFFGGFEELIVLPYGPLRDKPAVFKDMCQQTWDSTIPQPLVGPSFSSIQAVGHLLRRLEDTKDGHEAWVAPKFRVGMFGQE